MPPASSGMYAPSALSLPLLATKVILTMWPSFPTVPPSAQAQMIPLAAFMICAPTRRSTFSTTNPFCAVSPLSPFHTPAACSLAATTTSNATCGTPSERMAWTPPRPFRSCSSTTTVSLRSVCRRTVRLFVQVPGIRCSVCLLKWHPRATLFPAHPTSVYIFFIFYILFYPLFYFFSPLSTISKSSFYYPTTSTSSSAVPFFINPSLPSFTTTLSR
mmetsp:Transcript_20264/g.39731  ORF Transcript_20264/g.39731 Transcript_20264/m.39731 type:complete len:216 (-) Transcript_20264:345-992(-)